MEETRKQVWNNRHHSGARHQKNRMTSAGQRGANHCYKRVRRDVRKFTGRQAMAATLEETLISVWQQALVENARSVELEDRSSRIRRTSRSKLREVLFQFEGRKLRGLEQNPETASRWAQLARQGKKVMQFLDDRRYIAVVVDGKVQFFGKGLPGEEH